MTDIEQQDDLSGGRNGLSPGRQLSEARKANDMALESVSESTGIPLNVLEALEANDWGKLDAPVYVKGYLRKYASLLGLDPEAVIKSYETDALPSDPEIHAHVSEYLPTGHNVRWLIPLTGLIVIVLVIFVGLWSWHRFHARTDHAQAPASAVSAMMALTNAGPEQASSAKAGVALPGTDAGAATKEQATQPGLHLHLQIEQPSWVEVYGPDKKRLYYNLAAAGASLNFHATHEGLTVYLGNASGVRLTVNGHPFKIPASDISGHRARFKVPVSSASPLAGTVP